MRGSGAEPSKTSYNKKCLVINTYESNTVINPMLKFKFMPKLQENPQYSGLD